MKCMEKNFIKLMLKWLEPSETVEIKQKISKSILEYNQCSEVNSIQWVRNFKKINGEFVVNWVPEEVNKLTKVYRNNLDFTTHYDNFKPTLDQLVSKGTNSQSDLICKLRPLKTMKNFVTEDMQTIIECGGDKGLGPRERFYSKYSDDLPTSKIREYFHALEKINPTEGPSITDQLILTSRTSYKT
jgi:hypothetical protein